MSRDHNHAPPHSVSTALRRRVLRAVRAEPNASAGSGWRNPSRRALWPTLALAVAAALVVQVGPGGSAERVIPAALGRARLRVAGNYAELVVDRLPALGPDRTYELWLQAGVRPPAPSTLFGVSSQGTADIGIPCDPHRLTRLLVTVEPTGGTRAPTARPVIVAPLT